MMVNLIPQLEYVFLHLVKSLSAKLNISATSIESKYSNNLPRIYLSIFPINLLSVCLEFFVVFLSFKTYLKLQCAPCNNAKCYAMKKFRFMRLHFAKHSEYPETQARTGH
jgi:hypothetical protein